MIRKEENIGDARTIFYVVENGEVNVSKIISELSSIGCKGDELGEAYKKLMSDDKGYIYENKETNTKLLVIDERSFKRYCNGNPFVPLFWAFLMMRMFDADPYRDFIQDLKKGGEEVN